MMRIEGVSIDFINIRSEHYGDNSRIPTINKFGTPKGNAYRRNLTINSLFYHIRTKLVEDFTGKGIADLKSGKIITHYLRRKHLWMILLEFFELFILLQGLSYIG